ncbi:MAG: hypothetical protein Q8K92_06580 [Leadbetterella sp.]|nr:hypothetical protein [Leadbetterella sp.]
MSNKEHPTYFIKEILEQKKIEFHWENFIEEKSSGFHEEELDVDSDKKIITVYNTRKSETNIYKFQDYFLRKLEKRLNLSLESLAFYQINNERKFLGYIEYFKNNKNILRNFESEGFQFVDFIYNKIEDLLVFLNIENKPKENEKKIIPQKNEVSSHPKISRRTTEEKHKIVIDKMNIILSNGGISIKQASFLLAENDKTIKQGTIYNIYREMIKSKKSNNL